MNKIQKKQEEDVMMFIIRSWGWCTGRYCDIKKDPTFPWCPFSTLPYHNRCEEEPAKRREKAKERMRELAKIRFIENL